MKFCPGCSKPYANGVDIVSTFTETPFKGSCPECEQYFKTKLEAIEQKAFQNISRNQELNARFDSVYERSVEQGDLLPSGDPQYIQLRIHQFALLEEIHRYIYVASFESDLFYKFSIEGNNVEFFTERYFSTNAIMRTIAAWEKMIRFYSLSLDVEFDQNKKKNSLTNLRKKLGKTKCNETSFYKSLMKEKSNGTFDKLSQARIDNDHNTSRHIVSSLRDIVDLVWIVVSHSELLYIVVGEALDFWSRNVPSLNQTLLFADIPTNDFSSEFLLPKAQYVHRNMKYDRFNKIQFRTRKFQPLLSSLLMSPSKRDVPVQNHLGILLPITDMAFRLNDAARSLAYSFSLFEKAVQSNMPNIDDNCIFYENMNSRYFLFNALIRVYSAYDKIAITLQKIYNIAPDKNKTLDGLMESIRVKAPEHDARKPIKLIRKIMKQPEFNELYEARQSFSHNLTLQSNSPTYVREVLDSEQMLIVLRNIEMICDVMDVLIPELL